MCSLLDLGEAHFRIQDLVVPCSALAECFLKKMAADRFVHYAPGDEDFFTHEDEEEMGEVFGKEPLRPLNETVSIFLLNTC